MDTGPVSLTAARELSETAGDRRPVKTFAAATDLVKVHGLVLQLDTLGHRSLLDVLQVDRALYKSVRGVAVAPRDHALALQAASSALALELAACGARASETIALRWDAIAL